MNRRILHADFNIFYASVCLLFGSRAAAAPGCRSRRPGSAAWHYPRQKRAGQEVWRKDPREAIWQAKQKCPLLVTVKPDFASYQKFSALGRAIYGEYFGSRGSLRAGRKLDRLSGSTETFADAQLLAETIRMRIQEELGITVSIGVADNKVLPSSARTLRNQTRSPRFRRTVFKKSYGRCPRATCCMLAAQRRQSCSNTESSPLGIWQPRRPSFLKSQFGKCGVMLHAFANGLDASPVLRMIDQPPVKSVGNGITTPRDPREQ
jgi:DNA polymerase-4